MPHTDEYFLCPYCNKLKEWVSQMVIIGSLPEDADGIICGMPYQELGYCQDCVEGDGE